MFTIKFYSEDGFRQIIRTADSFTILRVGNGEAEITLHQKGGDGDSRVDIKHESGVPGVPPCFAKAIIENAQGKTTEIVMLGVLPGAMPPPRDVLSLASRTTGPTAPRPRAEPDHD